MSFNIVSSESDEVLEKNPGFEFETCDDRLKAFDRKIEELETSLKNLERLIRTCNKGFTRSITSNAVVNTETKKCESINKLSIDRYNSPKSSQSLLSMAIGNPNVVFSILSNHARYKSIFPNLRVTGGFQRQSKTLEYQLNHSIIREPAIINWTAYLQRLMNALIDIDSKLSKQSQESKYKDTDILLVPFIAIFEKNDITKKKKQSSLNLLIFKIILVVDPEILLDIMRFMMPYGLKFDFKKAIKFIVATENEKLVEAFFQTECQVTRVLTEAIAQSKWNILKLFLKRYIEKVNHGPKTFLTAVLNTGRIDYMQLAIESHGFPVDYSDIFYILFLMRQLTTQFLRFSDVYDDLTEYLDRHRKIFELLMIKLDYGLDKKLIHSRKLISPFLYGTKPVYQTGPNFLEPGAMWSETQERAKFRSCYTFCMMLENGAAGVGYPPAAVHWLEMHRGVLRAWNYYPPVPDYMGDSTAPCLVLEHHKKLNLLDEKFAMASVTKYFPQLVNQWDQIRFHDVDEYRRELESLKKIKISQRSPRMGWQSLYDFLFFDPETAARFARNLNLQELYEKSGQDFRLLYKYFGYCLNYQYRRGAQRISSIEEVSSGLTRALGYELPEEICLETFKPLSNEILRKLALGFQSIAE